jgi:nucleoside-diphosphate-sugar epimerase
VNVFVTGASGFIGSALVTELAARPKVSVIAASRKQLRVDAEVVRTVTAPELGPDADWRIALRGADTVVHAAARVHVLDDKTADPLAAYRYANVGGTLALAKQAATMGVQRFVFLSSIKVNGEATTAEPFCASDTPSPEDDYGVSKWEAEQALHELAESTGMEVVIVRPPLVYGPGVKANYKSLMNALWRRWPLPLAAANSNRRSLVYLGNLVDLLAVCLEHPAAMGRTFLVSDGEDMSTVELLQRQGQALERTPKLWNWSPEFIRFVLRLLRREAVYDRLFGSLQVDTEETRQALDWKPPISVENGLAKTANSYRTLVELNAGNV